MPADLARVKELFLAALEMPAPERAAYLGTACGGDIALRRQIEAMLQSHENSGELLPRSPAEMLQDGSQNADGTDAFVQQEHPSATWSTQPASEADDLSFLTASAKPGQLGQLGPYEVQQILGKGGFGLVLKGFDERLHRVVAIKVLSPAYAANGSARKRFIREARAAAAVKNEHVVGIHDVQEDAQPPYLVMEYVDGISLQERIDKQGALDIKQILRIGMQIAEGLAAAHKQGLVHRDIKPANILLENGVERVKITDFGLARAVDDASLSQSGVVAGTPMYMAPEQAAGEHIDHRADLFSLGSVLYVMSTGRPPFRASGTMAVMKRVIEDTPRPIRQINPEMPEWLEALIARLHAKKPEERFQAAMDVAELLEQHLAHLQHPTKVPLPPLAKASPGRAAVEDPVLAKGLRQVKAPAIGLLVSGLLYWASIPFMTAEVVAAPALPGSLLLFGAWKMKQCKWYLLSLATACLPLALLVDTLGNLIWGQDAMGPGIFVALPFGLLALVVLSRPQVRAAFASQKQVQTPPATPRRRFRLAVAAIGALMVCALAIYMIFLWGRREGMIEIVFGDEDITVSLEGTLDNGWVTRQIHRGQSPISLPPGEYTLFANKGKYSSDLVLHETFRLGPGDKKRFEVPPVGYVQLEVNHPDACRLAIDGAEGNYIYGWDFDPAWRVSPLTGGHWFPVQEVTVRLLNRSGQVIDQAKVQIKRNEKQLVRFLSKDDGWVQLFNGKDLIGWKVHHDQPGDWRIMYGWLVGSAGKPSHLFTERGDYENFHFRVEAKINAGGDSGQFFRCEYGLNSPISKQQTPLGYEANISFLNKYNTGSLWGVDWPPIGPKDNPIAPDTWFTQEVIARGNHIVIKVNGKTTVDFVDPNHRYRRGHLALQAWALGTVVYFRKVEIKELPPSQPSAVVQPFIILGKDAKSERKFATLAEAVAAAQSGDTIEIRGNGPFVSRPVFIRKALTIRAGNGYRPVIELDPAQVKGAIPLLETSTPLVLEGLQLRRIGKERHQAGPVPMMVRARGTPVRVANCRFVAFPDCVALLADWSPLCEVRNCEFLSDGKFARVDHNTPTGGQLILDNNVMLGGSVGAGFHYDNASLKEIAVRFTRNTFVVRTPIGLFVHTPLGTAPEAPAKPIQLAASRNLLDAQVQVMALSPTHFPPTDPLKVNEAQVLLKRLVGWSENKNVYPEAANLLALYIESPQPLLAGQNLADWNRFWGLGDTVAVRGDIRYRNGDLRSLALTQLEQVTAQDFRLADGSPGKGAGPGGKDLGADVDLVGPGPGYERWKKTPEYQEWLKRTRQVQPIAERKAFVVLGKEPSGEQHFATLAEAVAAAKSGDTIEIRDEGPFDLPAIDLGSKALILRAGQGFRPLLIPSQGSGLRTKAPLILEGLQFRDLREQGPRMPPAIIRQDTEQPLLLANCRFTVDNTIVPVSAYRSARADIRQCAFVLGPSVPHAIDWNLEAPGELSIEGCIFAGNAANLNLGVDEKRVGAHAIRFQRNTVDGYFPFLIQRLALWDAGTLDAHKTRPVTFRSRHNVFQSDSVLVTKTTSSPLPKLTAQQQEKLLKRLFAWQEERNIYMERVEFVGTFLNSTSPAPLTAPRPTLADWEAFWGLGPTTSLQGKIRFDSPAQRFLDTEKVTAEQFRLRKDCIGKARAPGGKDLGADVDLVGPGGAYERWMKTPDYQHWLKKTDQLITGK
jgi:serine/threonine protein kinase